jgi:hypothetical protein
VSSRRDFIKKVGYAAPTIVTLSALPSFAGAGSERASEIAVTNFGQFSTTKPKRTIMKKARRKGEALW